MRVVNYLVFCFIFVFLINGVSAQNLTCQYKDKQETGEIINYLQDKQSNNYTNPVEFREFTSQEAPCSCKIAFIVRNKIDKEISLKIQYRVIHNSVGLSSQGYPVEVSKFHPEEKEISIDSLGDYLIENEYLDWCHEQRCFVNQDSIRVSFISNDDTIAKVNNVYQDVCKKCNGEICLNDGIGCNNNSECGSGICNMGGICGTQKVVECSEGFGNCNNASCLEVNVKKVGETYSCEFECKTDYGENGICKVSMKEKISKSVFVVIFILISVFVIYLILSDKKLTEIVKRLFG